jgi:diguanylate cyclase (GGDEF)-like protein
LRRAALTALTAAIAIAAVALFVLVVNDLPGYGLGPQVPWWALAAAFAATELFVVHAYVRGSAHSLSISELPLILGLLLASPRDVVIAQIAGPMLVLALSRGHSPIKLVFNLGQFALTASLATITLHALAGPTIELGPEVWIAVFAAVGASAVTGATLVFAAIALSEGVIPSRRLALLMGADLLVAMTNTSVGLAAATLVARDAQAGWLLLAPAFVLLLAYRAYLSERTKHESLEFLYGVARSLSRAPDIESALVDLLRRTRDAFRVEKAEIVLFSAGDTPLRTALDDGGEERMEPLDGSLAGALRDCVGTEQATLVRCHSATGELRRYLEQQGIEEALIAPVPGETRLTGVMVLGDRVGAAASFSGEDVRLFETLANHAGISLEYDRLEQAVTRMRELQAKLERQAYRDSLTGLGNRAQFMRRLEESLRRGEGETTVLFVDLDDFKAINDERGHAAGDAVLMAVAERIRACVRPGDLAARPGGDEFAVLLEDVDDAHGESVATRVLDLLAAPVALGETAAWVHGSIGIATARAGSLGADELIRRADVAMYRAKEAGKGQVRVWCPEMHPARLARAPRREEIAAAIEAGELVAHFQPIVSLADGGVVAAEALARWEHPRHGLLGPATFVPAAEATGQVVALDRVVLEHACRAAAAWDGDGGRPPADASVHANLSGEGLRSFEIVSAVEDVLDRTGLDPARLVLEITESVLLAEVPIARKVLSALRALGVRIALDDFGTGHSSLQSLRELPVDIIKIAKAFTDGAPRTAHDRALMRMLVDLGALFEIRVVAEGIEREDQLTAVRELGCEMGQGYLLGRPTEPTAHSRALAGSASSSGLGLPH